MIYSKNILAGYVIFRGTALIHVPMLLIMLFWLRIDENNELQYGIPYPERDNTSFDGGWIWYVIALWQHAVLSAIWAMTLFWTSDELAKGSIWPMSFEGFKMITILI